jgi:hypothetical protein
LYIYIYIDYQSLCISFSPVSRNACCNFYDKVFQLLAWGSSVSSTNKTDHLDITEIMLKVSLNTINPNQINDIETCKNILSSIFVYTGCRTCKDIIGVYLNPDTTGIYRTGLPPNVYILYWRFITYVDILTSTTTSVSGFKYTPISHNIVLCHKFTINS